MAAVPQQRSQVPQFGNWESEDDTPYTMYFENAGKGKKDGKMNPNDTREYPHAEIKVQKGQEVTRPKHMRRTSREDGDLRRSADSPLHSDTMSQKSASGSPHHRQAGLRYASNRPELEVYKDLDVHRPRHERQLCREEGDLRRPNYAPLCNENTNPRSAHDSPYHRHGGTGSGDTPKRVARLSVGSDRSIEHSPHHPHSQARVSGKGSAMSSPSWERKGSSEAGHGLAPSTPGRSRLRSVTRGDETPDHSPAVPKFGDWDESDPASADGYSYIFNRVREEKQTGAGKVPMMPTEASYTNGQKRIATNSPKSCGCFPWSR